MAIDNAARGLALAAQTSATAAATQYATNNLSGVASAYTTAKNLGIGYVVASSNAIVAHTGDTSAFVFDTIALPALGANDVLQVMVEFNKVGTAGTFTPTVKLGTTLIMNPGAIGATILFSRGFNRVMNKGATNAQQFGPAVSAMNAPFANSTAAMGTGTEETNAGINLVIGGTLASSADTLNRASYQVILFPKA